MVGTRVLAAVVDSDVAEHTFTDSPGIGVLWLEFPGGEATGPDEVGLLDREPWEGVVSSEQALEFLEDWMLPAWAGSVTPAEEHVSMAEERGYLLKVMLFLWGGHVWHCACERRRGCCVLDFRRPLGEHVR